MKPNIINVWSWLYEFHRKARSADDPIRSRFYPLYNEASELFERSPETARQILMQGRVLAEQMNEPLWVMYFDYWLTALLLWYTEETSQGLDLAARNVVKVSKPEFQRWSFVPRIHMELICAYIKTDPLSHVAYIQDGLHMLDTELNFDSDVWCRIPEEYSNLLQAQGDAEGALKKSQEFGLRSEGDDFHLTDAYQQFCHIEHALKRFDDVIQHGQIGEIHARRDGTKYGLIRHQLWQAIGYLKLGDREDAERQYQAALATIHILGDAFLVYRTPEMAIYHEYTGNLDNAMTIHRACCVHALRSGNLYAEFRARLEICRMLKIMGLLSDEEITMAQAALNHLKVPSLYSPRLDAILAGDASPIL